MVKERARTAARAVFAFFLLFLSLHCAAAEEREPPSIEERLAYLRGFGARIEGTMGESGAFDYVETSLRGMGISPSIGDFSDTFEDYSRSRIVEALIRGAKADELAIIVPIGSWIDAPDDAEGAFGVALALDEAARLSTAAKEGKGLPISIRFVFLGAEKRGGYAEGEIAGLGSKTWISRQEGRGRLAVLYLNLPFPVSRVEMRSAAKGVLSPYWYYEGTRRALDASGIAFEMKANRQEVFRLGLASDYGPTAPYLEAGIPAIEIRGVDRTEARNEAKAPNRGSGSVEQGAGGDPATAWFHAFIGLFATGMAGGFSEAWDRHYFIVQLGRFVAILREKSYVAILVGLVAIVALSILAATVARRQVVKRLLRRLPLVGVEVLALFGVLVAVIFIGKGLTLLEAAVLGSRNAWTLFPRVFAVSRITFCFLMFLSVLSYLVEKKILTSNPYFYEFVALSCLAIDVLVFSVVDLSASFYFIWALVIVEVSLAIRKRWATLLAYVLMYLPLLIVAGELFMHPDLVAYGRLITPDLLGVFTVAALSLPFFVFTASPLLFLAPPGNASRNKAMIALIAIAIAVEGSALISFRIAVPSNGPGRRDLRFSESIDQDQGRFELRLAGAQRLGKGSFRRGDVELDYDESGDTARFTGEDRKKGIEIEESMRPFLDRVDENIRVVFASPPYSVELALRSEEAILLYDCSLPYKVAVDGKSATIYAGVNPGETLSFSLTVPASFRSEMVVRARYLSPLEPCSQSSGSPLRFSGLTVTASGRIGGGGPGG
jgi:hypothetical protein